MEIHYRHIAPIRSKLLQLELLRDDAYQMKSSYDERMHYLKNLERRRFLAIASYYRGLLVAGCYVSSCYHSLLIQQLFVGQKWQGSEEHFGSNLLLKVLSERAYFEKAFQTELMRSRLVAYDVKSKQIYEKLGYHTIVGNTMEKNIQKEGELHVYR